MSTDVVSARTVGLELARRRFLPFVKVMFPRYEVNPVGKLIAAELEWFEQEVEAGRSPRLILEVPPRVGKSELVSRKYPGWLLGRHPSWYIGLVSYGADLAESLSRDARRVVMGPEYGEVFWRAETEEIEHVEIDKTSKAVHEWRLKPSKDNPQPGGCVATGLSGTLTGRGFNVLILDDPHKNWEEANSRTAKDRVWSFYVGTLYDRLEPGAGILVVQQRWAVDDLVGRLLDADDTVDDEGFDIEYLDKWRVVRLPAQAEPGEADALGRKPGEWLPARYTPAQWERVKANNLKKNPRIWWAKFQQRPAGIEGGVFQPYQWLRFEEPDEDEDGPVFIFGDTSYAKRQNSDFNCFGVWRYERRPWRYEDGRTGDCTFRLIEVYRKRSKFPELRRDIAAMCFRYGLVRPAQVLSFSAVQPRVWIEDKSSGQSLIQEFMEPVQHPELGLVRLPVRAWNPQKNGDKDARAHSVTDMLSEGLMAVPKQALWLPHLLKTMGEYQGEGSVEYDDEIDMLSMSLILLGTLRPRKVKQREMGAVPFTVVA